MKRKYFVLLGIVCVFLVVGGTVYLFSTKGKLSSNAFRWRDNDSIHIEQTLNEIIDDLITGDNSDQFVSAEEIDEFEKFYKKLLIRYMNGNIIKERYEYELYRYYTNLEMEPNDGYNFKINILNKELERAKLNLEYISLQMKYEIYKIRKTMKNTDKLEHFFYRVWGKVEKVLTQKSFDQIMSFREFQYKAFLLTNNGTTGDEWLDEIMQYEPQPSSKKWWNENHPLIYTGYIVFTERVKKIQETIHSYSNPTPDVMETLNEELSAKKVDVLRLIAKAISYSYNETYVLPLLMEIVQRESFNLSEREKQLIIRSGVHPYDLKMYLEELRNLMDSKEGCNVINELSQNGVSFESGKGIVIDETSDLTVKKISENGCLLKAFGVISEGTIYASINTRTAYSIGNYKITYDKSSAPTVMSKKSWEDEKNRLIRYVQDSLSYREEISYDYTHRSKLVLGGEALADCLRNFTPKSYEEYQDRCERVEGSVRISLYELHKLGVPSSIITHYLDRLIRANALENKGFEKMDRQYQSLIALDWDVVQLVIVALIASEMTAMAAISGPVGWVMEAAIIVASLAMIKATGAFIGASAYSYSTNTNFWNNLAKFESGIFENFLPEALFMSLIPGIGRVASKIFTEPLLIHVLGKSPTIMSAVTRSGYLASGAVTLEVQASALTNQIIKIYFLNSLTEEIKNRFPEVWRLREEALSAYADYLSGEDIDLEEADRKLEVAIQAAVDTGVSGVFFAGMSFGSIGKRSGTNDWLFIKGKNRRGKSIEELLRDPEMKKLVRDRSFNANEKGDTGTLKGNKIGEEGVMNKSKSVKRLRELKRELDRLCN